MGESAFENSGIKKVQLNNGITKVPRYCFRENVDLNEVVLPNSINTIDDYAFELTMPKISTTKINIPSNVQYIGTGILRLHVRPVVALAWRYERWFVPFTNTTWGWEYNQETNEWDLASGLKFKVPLNMEYNYVQKGYPRDRIVESDTDR